MSSLSELLYPTAKSPMGDTLNNLVGQSPNGWQSNDQDLRADGTKKGNGWLGILQRPDGGVSTEISAGFNLDGKDTEIPLIVPGLSKDELDYLLNNDVQHPDFMKMMPNSITQKAVDHARQQMQRGLNPFNE